MIIGISGSATPGGSTDILTKEVLRSLCERNRKTKLVRLNELKMLPCQACGKSPEPEPCFFHDDAYSLLQDMLRAEAIVMASPVYFDSVSAQMKLLIDRSNCLRPADFSRPDTQRFAEPLLRGKKGGIILVAGAHGHFMSALKVMRAFFIWAGIEIKFELKFRSRTLFPGEAAENKNIMKKAYDCGLLLGGFEKKT